MKLLKRILLWSLGLALLVVIQGLILVYIYENEIKQAAISKLNNQLNTPIKVGKIELSYFEHFPFLSLTFPEVVIYGSKPYQNEILLSAKEISLLFNVWDIYKGDHIVKKLYVEDGAWTSNIDKQGISNFNIIKKSNNTGNSDNSKFKITIEEIIIKNTSIHYVDQEINQSYRLLLNDLKATGNFNEESFKLDIKTNSYIQSINLSGITYLKNKKINLNTSLLVNIKNQTLELNKTEAELEKLKLVFDGKIDYAGELVKLNVSGKDINIQSFVSLLPPKYAAYFKDYTSNGQLYFNANINGKYDKQNVPSVNVSAGFINTTIQINNENIKNQEIKNLDFKLNYSNFGTSTISDDKISIEQFKGVYHEKAISGKLIISNFKDPYIDFALITEQELVELQKIWPLKDVKFNSGDIFINVNIKSKLTELKNSDKLKEIYSDGIIRIKNTSLNPGKYALSINNINGDFAFQKADLKINDLTFSIGKSDFKINGFFRNLFSFVLADNEDLEIDAKLISKNIDLKELLGSSANSTEEEPYKLKINKRINANITLQVKEVSFMPFQAFDMQGNMVIENQNVSSNYLAFRSQKGLVFAKLNFNTKNQTNMPMDINLNLNKVDVSNLFKEFNNFGMEIITDKNLRGQISANMDLHLIWDDNLKSKMDNFSAKGNVLIENGQLLDFEPMLALGKYIDVNELRNLRFSNLENTIEIKNNTIFIPDMEVKSNALSMRLSGTHTFENKIDYHLQLLLSDFIKKKSNKLGDERFGEIEKDETGNTKLFIRMYGDAYNPSFSLDKKMIKKKIAEDLKKERAEVKQILKDEFGSWFKKEKEFKETINEEAAEWENDLPIQKPQNKSVTSSQKSDSLASKSKLQRLKDKLKEKPPVEDE